MKTTLYEKKLWNSAVRATLSELRKWDGIITKEDAETLTVEVTKRVAYKIGEAK